VLRQRVLTAVVAVATILVVVFVLPDWATIIALGIVILAGAWEWGAFVQADSIMTQTIYTLSVALALLATWFVMGNVPGSDRWILVAGLAGWLVALVLVFRFPTRFSPPFVVLAGLWILISTFLALAYLYLSPDGKRMLMLLLIIVWSADIGAYFAGRRYGRIKLAPSVSPGKSWEGVGGGLIVVAAVALLASVFLDRPASILLPLALASAAISIVGDLTVSMFKRNASVKDSGRLFPGHGGVLDRIDSVSAAAPLFALFVVMAGA